MSIKRIIIRAFLLSILLHLIVFNFFNFRFDSKKEPVKPSLNFLGSFLRKHDTESSPIFHQLSETKRNYPENIDSKTSSSDPSSRIFNDDQKPELKISNQPNFKKTLKTEPFASTPQKKSPELLKNSETSSSISHIHLKLPNDDHY
ncbi:MAG: hypothetical protein P9M12_02105 [Candidatus Aceula lacicola]|nr:hypothetical protein [Candidatus Aceula lacicola]